MQQVAPDDAARCNTSGRVKPAEAARLLGINRSSLSRYLQQYEGLLDAEGTVDVAQLKQHRADNPRIADASASSSEAKPAKADHPTRRGGKHRLEEIKTWEAERDWAVSINQLVDPTKQLDAVVEAASALRDRMMGPEPVFCERLAEERDPRTIQSILREANRAQLEDFIATLKKAIATGQAPQDDAAP
ncbi:MAG TPA: hypothetical protein VGF56_05810 [Rhizomicrobium sp.]|jgi:hypothetical protein